MKEGRKGDHWEETIKGGGGRRGRGKEEKEREERMGEDRRERR